MLYSADVGSSVEILVYRHPIVNPLRLQNIAPLGGAHVMHTISSSMTRLASGGKVSFSTRAFSFLTSSYAHGRGTPAHAHGKFRVLAGYVRVCTRVYLLLILLETQLTLDVLELLLQEELLLLRRHLLLQLPIQDQNISDEHWHTPRTE